VRPLSINIAIHSETPSEVSPAEVLKKLTYKFSGLVCLRLDPVAVKIRHLTLLVYMLPYNRNGTQTPLSK